MKTFKKILLIFLVITSINCSKEEDGGSQDNSLTRYEDVGEVQNQLFEEIYMSSEGGTTYIYGDVENDEIKNTFSVAYRSEDNPDLVYHFLLDEFYRVKEIYSETAGVKDDKIYAYAYSYPEVDLVYFIVKERNWSRGEETLLSFTPVELEEDQYLEYPIDQVNATSFGKNNMKLQDNPGSSTTKSGWKEVVAHSIGTAAIVGGIAIGGFVVAGTYGVAAGVVAALVWAGAAVAEEPSLGNKTNPEAPMPAEFHDPCKDSGLEVSLGVDDNNEATAIVNGNSDKYTFYWSTGAVATASIANTTSIPDDSDACYVMVVDEQGCLAFSSANRTDVDFRNDYPLLEGYYEVHYASGGRWLLEVESIDWNHTSHGKVYQHSDDTGWYYPSYEPTFFAKYTPNAGIRYISVEIDTNGCLSHYLHMLDDDPTKEEFTAEVRGNLGCHGSSEEHDPVNLKYVGTDYL